MRFHLHIEIEITPKSHCKRFDATLGKGKGKEDS